LSTPRTFQVTISPDIILSCAEQGSATGGPLLLVHGYSDSRISYEPLMAALPGELRTLAVTLRGHGGSAKPDAGYTIGDFAADLAILLDRLEVERALVVGHSMGSMVAQQLALDLPERVRGLVLIGALTTLKGNAAAEELWDDPVSTMADLIDPSFVRAFQESTLARPVQPAFLDAVVAESLKVPARVWRAALRAMLGDDLEGQLHRIAAPTLILWGDRDGLCDRAGQLRLERSLPDARLSVQGEAGHAPHWEDPEGVAAEIADFAAQAAA